MPDESDGVGEDEGPAVVELTAPGGRFQGGEQCVLHQYPAPVSALSRLDFPALV